MSSFYSVVYNTKRKMDSADEKLAKLLKSETMDCIYLGSLYKFNWAKSIGFFKKIYSLLKTGK